MRLPWWETDLGLTRSVGRFIIDRTVAGIEITRILTALLSVAGFLLSPCRRVQRARPTLLPFR